MRVQKYNPEQVKVTVAVPNRLTCQFSLTEIHIIQSIAKDILKKVLAGNMGNAHIGICYKIYTAANFEISGISIMRLVGQIATRWPHSASPGKYSVNPVPQVAEDEPRWEGVALKHRISLLRYIIKRLNDTIRRAEKNGKAIIC